MIQDNKIKKQQEKSDKILKTVEIKDLNDLADKLVDCDDKYTLYKDQYALIKILLKGNKILVDMDDNIKHNLRDSLVLSYVGEDSKRHKKGNDELKSILSDYLQCKASNEWDCYDVERKHKWIKVPMHIGKLRRITYKYVDICNQCKQFVEIQWKCKDKICKEPNCKYALCGNCKDEFWSIFRWSIFR